MASGPAGRVRARIISHVAFPLRMVAEAAVQTDVVVPTTNPFHLPAWLVLTRPLHGNRVIPLVYDLYPDALEAAGVTSSDTLSSRLLAHLNRAWLERADGVVFIGDRMASHACARYGRPRRSVVIPTGASASEFASVVPNPAPDSPLATWCRAKEVVVTYIGNLGLMHDWTTFASGVLRLCPPHHERWGLVVAASGPGVAHLRQQWSSLNSDVVRLEGPLSDRDWAELLSNSQVSIVTLRAEAAQTSIPSKTFSAMAAGHAILAVAPEDSDLADLVRRHRCGIVVPPGDVDGFSRALELLVTDRQERDRARAAARQAVVDHYDMPILAEQWKCFLDEVVSGSPPPLACDRLKRAVDVVLGGAGLVGSAAFLFPAMAAVRITLGEPVLFRQQRPGLHAKPFQLLKLRTMRHAKPYEKGPEFDATRITALGRFLRATSIDELPTLWNVLRGDMSLVGPRPLLMRYLPRYSKHQARRHDVKPGITGWAQVNGRNTLSWDEKFDLDVWYVDHRSWLLDLRILAMTVGKVLRRDGISKKGHATMPEFMGHAQVEAD
jgi:lipopolysaccharide/colanic/teichoic acid biosynthesis glycosyltransferase/glycosyltransferase involved in cell wall biosynthesis